MSRRFRIGLCVAVLAVGAVQLSIAFSRSMIPYRIEGTVWSINDVSHTHERIHTITVGDRTYVTDHPRIEQIPIGTQVEKDAWSTTATIGSGRTFRLTLGEEVFRFAALVLLAAIASWAWTGRRIEDPDREVAGSAGRSANG